MVMHVIFCLDEINIYPVSILIYQVETRGTIVKIFLKNQWIA